MTEENLTDAIYGFAPEPCSSNSMPDGVKPFKDGEEEEEIERYLNIGCIDFYNIFSFSLLEQARIMFECEEKIEFITKNCEYLYKRDASKYYYYIKNKYSADLESLRRRAVSTSIIVFSYYNKFEEWESIITGDFGPNATLLAFKDVKECLEIVYRLNPNEEHRAKADAYMNGTLPQRKEGEKIMEGLKYYRDNKI